MKTVTFTLLFVVTTVQYQQVNCVIPADINGQIINLIVKKIGTLLSLKQPILPKIITAINPKISKIFRAKQPQQNVETTVSTNFVDSTTVVENYPPLAPPSAEYGAPQPAPPPSVEYGAPPPPPVEYGAPPPSVEYGAPPPPPPVVYGIAPAPPSQDYGLGPA